MADTTPDASHLDQLSLVLHHATPSGAIHERLVDMNHMDKRQETDKHWPPWRHFATKKSAPIAFQSYTSSMPGKFKGCQAKFSAKISIGLFHWRESWSIGYNSYFEKRYSKNVFNYRLFLSFSKKINCEIFAILSAICTPDKRTGQLHWCLCILIH